MTGILKPLKQAFDFAPAQRGCWTSGSPATAAQEKEYSSNPLNMMSRLSSRAAILRNRTLSVPDALMNYELPTNINEKQHVQHQVIVPFKRIASALALPSFLPW